MDKREIRQHIKRLKLASSFEYNIHSSKLIVDAVEQLAEFEVAQNILAYWSLADEVHTHEAVVRWSQEKQIYLPVVNGSNLDIVKFAGVEHLSSQNLFGVGEPLGADRVDIAKIDLIVVPGVAFTRNGHRLGRGKGYYDRLLESAAATKVGVCYSFQILQNIPTDYFDIPMDLVITELTTYRK